MNRTSIEGMEGGPDSEQGQDGGELGRASSKSDPAGPQAKARSVRSDVRSDGKGAAGTGSRPEEAPVILKTMSMLAIYGLNSGERAIVDEAAAKPATADDAAAKAAAAKKKSAKRQAKSYGKKVLFEGPRFIEHLPEDRHPLASQALSAIREYPGFCANTTLEDVFSTTHGGLVQSLKARIDALESEIAAEREGAATAKAAATSLVAATRSDYEERDAERNGLMRQLSNENELLRARIQELEASAPAAVSLPESPSRRGVEPSPEAAEAVRKCAAWALSFHECMEKLGTGWRAKAAAWIFNRIFARRRNPQHPEDYKPLKSEVRRRAAALVWPKA